MKMAIGSDSVLHITDTISAYLEAKGVELVRCAALAGDKADCVDAARDVAEKVASGQCDQGEIVDAWLQTEPSDEPRRKVFHRKTDELGDEFRR